MSNTHTMNDSFGLCPICKAEPTIRNIYKVHVAACDEHRVKWDVGINLFSSWRHEDEKQWRENAELLATYSEVEAFFYPRKDGDKITAHWQLQVETNARHIAAVFTDLAETMQKERTGIRDGNGYWHGGDVYGYLLGDQIPNLRQSVVNQWNQIQKAEQRLKEIEQILSGDLGPADLPF